MSLTQLQDIGAASGTQAQIGVIGGSGMYDLDSLEHSETVHLETPYGSPSGPVTVGTLAGRRVAFIARHGIGHHLLPSEVPYRANLAALRQLGVRQVFAVSAVGSLSEQLRQAPWWCRTRSSTVPGAPGQARSSAAGWWAMFRWPTRTVSGFGTVCWSPGGTMW